MDSQAMLLASIFALTSVAIYLCLLAAFDRDIGRAARLMARARALSPASTRRTSAADARRQSIEELLSEVEEGRAPARVRLKERIRQAGLSWDVRTYAAICLLCGVVCALASWMLLGAPWPAAVLFGLAAGIGAPRVFVEQKRAHRFRAFSKEFANAVDIVVRGVRAGLPLGDCLRIISSEAKEPVRGEFRQIVEDQALGLPAVDAVQRLPARMPTNEAKFFAIVLAIQATSGGSLSEALGNLSKVIRDRQKMHAKVRAVSAEARASALIIGSLPPAVSLVMYVTSPAYISILFKDPAGHLVLAACALWMCIGALVMRRMINFDF